MFHFSIDSKYLLDVNIDELAEQGVIFDYAFQKKFTEDLRINFEQHGLSCEDACYELDLLDMQGFFKIEESPSNVDECLKIISKFFFHPPYCIWFERKSYKIAGNYGEIDYYNGTSIIKTGDPEHPKMIFS